MFKKITAIISAITLLVGSLSVPTLLSQAAGYTGKLTIAGAIVENNTNPTAFYIQGTDEYETGYSSGNWPDSTMVPAANDMESGIFVDGNRINDYFSAGDHPNSVRLRKFSDSGNDYYIERIPNVTTGSVVTIKGTFYTYGGWMQEDIFDASPIVYEESSFKWNGTQWEDYVAPEEPDTPEPFSGVLAIAGAESTNNTNQNAFYIKGTDGYQTGSDSWPELTMMPNADDTESGIFVDGVRVNDYFSAGDNPNSVRLRKYNDTNNYYYIERIPNVQNGSVVTIKGTFHVYGNWMETNQFDSTPITFTESSFKWNGSQWEDYVAPEEPDTPQSYTGVLTIEGALAVSSNSAAFYMEGTDEYRTGSDSWPELTMMPNADDTESGIFVDGVRINDYFSAGDNPNSVRLRKFSDSGNDYYIERIPNVQNGSVVTIKGTFHVYGNWMETDQYDSTPIIFTESSFKWNGSQWVDYVPTTDYQGALTIESHNTGDATHTYLTGTDTYPTVSWDIELKALNDESGIYVGETKVDAAYLKKVDANAYYMSGFGTVEIGTVITIKGTFGVADSTQTVTFEETKIQWNGGSQWVKYVPIERFNGTLSLSGAETTGNASCMFLKGTDEMPAGGWELAIYAADELSGIYLNDVKQADAYVKKYDGVNCWYYAAGFAEANEGDKLTIKGNFGYDNYIVKLESITFEWAEGAWATPVIVDTLEENVALEIDYATMVSGGNEGGIYLNTTDSMPAPGWEAIIAPMRGSSNGVFYNGEKSNAFLKKYTDGKYYVCLQDVGIYAEDGDEITIDGQFVYGSYVVDFDRVTFYYNGQKWATTYTAPIVVNYKDVTITGLKQASQFVTERDRWEFWIDVDSKLPGESSQVQFGYVKVSINGQEYEFHSTRGQDQTLYMDIYSKLLPHLPQEDTLVTIQAGQYTSLDRTLGINLTEDYHIYINQYGMSTEKFMTPYIPAETNVEVSIDRDSAFGGGENGIYLKTADKFKVDETWSTLIRGIAYDDESGVFYNGVKIDSIMKKFADGKIYVDLLSAGITAKDKDEVVLKGTFYLDDYAVSYKEIKFYFNGKQWNTTYIEAKEVYVDITGVSVNKVSQFMEDRNIWVVYLNVEGKLPGEIDKLAFHGLEIIVDGKKLDTTTHHSYQDCLYFAIPQEYMSKDAPNGTAITIKAGKALSENRIDGINWTKDFTIYTFLGQLTEEKPTNNTKWQDIKIEYLPNVMKFNKDAKLWEIFARPNLPLTTENDTNFYQLPLSVAGKNIKVTVIQAGDNIYFQIPEDVLSGDTKSATLTIKKGATAIANAGRDGIRFTEDYTMYLYNGVWSDYDYKETTVTSINCVGMQNAQFVETADGGYWNMYFWSDVKIAGTSWYEQYDDFTAYYNGKEFQTRLCKAASSNGRLFYLVIQSNVVGAAKEGDIITVKPHKVTCGAYKIKFANEFAIQYRNGIWSEYIETDVEEPVDDKMLWEVARFDSAYIPLSENGTVNFTNSDKYNKITSMEEMKDYTVSFTSTKLSNDNTTPSVSVVLRGKQIDDETEMSTGTLYGYVVEFKAIEERIDDETSKWIGEVNLWKNGRKTGLMDQYRIAYQRDTEKTFFGFNEACEYEFSIYNVTETCACITVKVNGEVVLRHYDHASDDPMDPAVNAGNFAIFAEGMSGIYDGIYEVDEVLATSKECKVGEAVWVSGSYPYVMSKTEFSVDKEGASVANGVFKATEAGEYQVTCTYDGKEIKPTTISVAEADVPVDDSDVSTGTNWMLIGVVAAAVIVVGGVGVAIAVVVKRRKKHA